MDGLTVAKAYHIKLNDIMVCAVCLYGYKLRWKQCLLQMDEQREKIGSIENVPPPVEALKENCFLLSQ